MVKGDVSPAARRDLKVAAGEARQARRLRAERDGVFGESTKRSSSSGKLDHKMMPPASSQLSIGTKLVKSYRGITHVVEVTPNGMLHQGTTYRSLSAVAKAITGTHWNGLLFFGLRQRKVYPKKLADHG